MTLAKNSKLIRFAYLTTNPEALHIPNRTTLCALFWRCVLSALITLTPVGLAIAYIVNLIFDPRRTLMITAGIACGLALVSGLVYLWQKIETRHKHNRYAYHKPSLVTEALWGLKHKVCPVIELVDSGDVENDGV